MTDIHPDLQKIAKFIPSFSFTANNLWLWRFLERFPLPFRPPREISIENRLIPGAAPSHSLRLRIYRPEHTSAPTPAMLWIHGGGYIIGRPEQDDAICCRYVHELGLLVVSVDYRRAPEHPFPAALDDAYAALKWLHDHADHLQIDPHKMVIAGASAGGGLAAALAQYAVDRQEVPLAFQLLVYPMLDDRTLLRPEPPNRRWLGWSPKSNRFGWDAYLGKRAGTDDVPAYAAAARRSNLAGLPPAWIGVGSLDLFYEEDLDYCRRLRDSGIDCVIDTVAGGFHGFDLVGPRLAVVKDFNASQYAAMRLVLDKE